MRPAKRVTAVSLSLDRAEHVAREPRRRQLAVWSYDHRRIARCREGRGAALRG